MTKEENFFDGFVNNLKNYFDKLPEEKKNDQISVLEVVKQELVRKQMSVLALQKSDDLKTVRELCKKHRFTATALKGCLVTKAAKNKSLKKGEIK